jgi:hypothetical protein
LKELTIVRKELAEYLKFSPDEAKKFTYYTFDIPYTENWDVFGAQYLSTDPLLVDIRLMQIDQDARDWEQFIAERDTPGYVEVEPATYPLVVAFFEKIVGKGVEDAGQAMRYFSLVDREGLMELHYRTTRVDDAVGGYYRYRPDEGIQPSDMVSVVCMPQWSRRYGANQVSSLWFLTFPQQRLDDPSFDLIMSADGLGTMRFNRDALEELIILLKRHTYS